MRAFPKPSEIEQRVTLTPKQEREQLRRKIEEQRWLCWYCDEQMNVLVGHMKMATRDHITPQPRSCSKDSSDRNVVACCWACNYAKGSQRGWTQHCNRRVK
jgi:hypothetical protein